jgi:hypothetical protein
MGRNKIKIERIDNDRIRQVKMKNNFIFLIFYRSLTTKEKEA